jgi:hypothetical protein
MLLETISTKTDRITIVFPSVSSIVSSCLLFLGLQKKDDGKQFRVGQLPTHPIEKDFTFSRSFINLIVAYVVYGFRQRSTTIHNAIRHGVQNASGRSPEISNIVLGIEQDFGYSGTLIYPIVAYVAKSRPCRCTIIDDLSVQVELGGSRRGTLEEHDWGRHCTLFIGFGC